LILKLKRQSRLLAYVNSYSETFSARCTSVKVKIWVIYQKFSGTGNFRTLAQRPKLICECAMGQDTSDIRTHSSLTSIIN